MRIIEFKYYPRPTGSIIGRSCRGGSGSASKSRSTIGCGATISHAIGDGADCWPTTEDGPPIEAGDGTVWGDGDAPMSVEGVCNPVCGVEEDENGICEGGTEGALGATTGICNPMGGGWEYEDGIWIAEIDVRLCNPVGGGGEDKDGICKPEVGVMGLSGIRST